MPGATPSAALPAALVLLLAAPAMGLALGAPAAPLQPGPQDLAALVDPMIGTAVGGFTFPGAAVPFGMVQLSPDTTGPAAYTGYAWTDPFVRGFSHVHIESMGVRTAGNLPFMPAVGPLLGSHFSAWQQPLDHALERAEAGYYSLGFPNGVAAELTAGLRVGVHRYTFPPVPEALVVLDVGRSVAGTHHASAEVVDARTVEGSAWTPQGYPVHFVARFSRPFEAHGGWLKEHAQPQPGVAAVEGRGVGLYVAFDATRDPEVRVEVGLSFVSRAGARGNLEAELPAGEVPFEAVRARARAAWNEALAAVRVEGGAEGALRSFTTALYHAYHHPNVFTDADGQYLGHDGKAHRAEGYVHYATFGMWDTYRGEMQLLALTQPARFRDMVRTLLVDAEQHGRLARFSVMNRHPDHMIGEPAVPVLADALCRGLVRPEDEPRLWAAVRDVLLERSRDPLFLTLGWIPHDRNDGGASVTLEQAIAAFGGALVADRLGHAEDRDRLLGLAGHWRNVFDADDTRFVRPRLSDGTWLGRYLPELPFGFVEGTGWQYTWLVPHDVRGLFEAIDPEPGDAEVLERLDTFFAQPLAAAVPGPAAEAQAKLTVHGLVYAGNQYAPSNEHDLHAPYLHAWAGQPWKSQEVLRGLQALYRPAPDGLPGNDDTGSLSAWFVWSALGLYPAVAGAPLYVLGSPLFERAVVQVEGGAFEVRAPGAGALGKYVQSAALDGAPWDRAWLHHDALAAGGTLELRMGEAPAEGWASGPHAAPPSLSTHGLAGFGCGPGA